MTAQETNSRNKGIEGRECVPYFKTNTGQIIFEFFYLLGLLAACCAIIITIQFEAYQVTYKNKVFIYTLLGGFIGGWVYDAKWFYRVTARGKDDQYNYLWQCHKFYWRILTPFLSAIVAFITYNLIASDMLPITIKKSGSAISAFSICFVFGYFSDLVLSRLAAWAEEILPKAKKKDPQNG